MFRFPDCHALGIESTDTELPIEEEFVTDDLNLDVVNDELQAMKTHITKLQGMLFLNIDECPTKEPCTDLEIELGCSKNTEICALQRNNYKLQSQICEILQCCQLIKAQLQDLHARHCIEMKQLQRFEKMMDEFNSFKLQLEHKFALCIERFEYLKHVKSEWLDVIKGVEELKRFYQYYDKLCVPKKCFVEEKKSFLLKISEIRTICQGLHTMFMERISDVEARLFQKCQKQKTKAQDSISML